MTSSLGGLLVHRMQEKLNKAIEDGLNPTDYSPLSRAVYDSLAEINLQVSTGESLVLPNGAEYTKTSNKTRDRKWE